MALQLGLSTSRNFISHLKVEVVTAPRGRYVWALGGRGSPPWELSAPVCSAGASPPVSALLSFPPISQGPFPWTPGGLEVGRSPCPVQGLSLRCQGASCSWRAVPPTSRLWHGCQLSARCLSCVGAEVTCTGTALPSPPVEKWWRRAQPQPRREISLPSTLPLSCLLEELLPSL